MIGSFLTRGLVMVFGYAYPAYECFKIVEKNKPEIEQLRFWCQYWILVAVLAVFERIGDALISWIPMYSEAKLAFYIYLWYPKTKGTTYVYDSFFKPYVAKHETDIDRNLLEMKTRAGDIMVVYCQRLTTFAHSRLFHILHYLALQQSSSSTLPPSSQKPHEIADSGRDGARNSESPVVLSLDTKVIVAPKAGAAEKAPPQSDISADEITAVGPTNSVVQKTAATESVNVVSVTAEVVPPKADPETSKDAPENSVVMPDPVIIRSSRLRLRRANK